MYCTGVCVGIDVLVMGFLGTYYCVIYHCVEGLYNELYLFLPVCKDLFGLSFVFFVLFPFTDIFDSYVPLLSFIFVYGFSIFVIVFISPHLLDQHTLYSRLISNTRTSHHKLHGFITDRSYYSQSSCFPFTRNGK